MTMESSSCSLQFLPLFLLILLPVVTKSTTFSITNRCSYTMWPAAVPGGGIQLHPGEWWTLNVPDGTTGRVWARTACSFNGAGNGKCETGDCGGVLACTDYGKAPNTIAEFAIAQFNNMDFFDISLVDGFNVPMDFLPVPANGQGGEGCSKGPRCAANITPQCPSELKAPGGCNNACTVLKQDIYCCTGNSSTSCGPTNYSKVFKRICPDAYSYPKDDATSTFTCPTGTSYMVVFCPPINISALALPPDANPPAPVATQPPAANPTAPIPTETIQKHSSSFARARAFAVILGSVGSLIVLTVFITFLAYKRRTRQHQEMEEADEEFGELLGTPARFTFQQLHEATNQFRDKLGEGGFGSVFEGQYREERIAVKRLDGAGQGKREFLAEVHTIGNIHHINLVRLIGFCAEKSHRLLVYEYMPKGSLDKWIHSRHENDALLDWQTRRKIITHIAKGLSYLHEECMKRIARLDVKPQNILLDENFNAKLSDFGLCKLIDRDKSQVITRMRGTPGYLAPEWLTSQITEKADVYSFGVVVMEIISGRKNLDTSKSEESIHLITLLEEKVKSDQLADLIDKHNADMQAHKQDVIQVMQLAMWCLQMDCKRRPQMSEVVKVLEGSMDAETNIDHSFVATSAAMFGAAQNIGSSSSAHASDLSGPRELRGSQSPTAASLEAHTALADTHSPPRMVQLSFADAEAPGVDGEDAAEPPTAPAPVAAAPTAASVAAFIDSMRLPLQEPLIKTPPRARTVRAVNNDWIPRRSDRLAAKSAFHDPQPEKKARRVMLNKWAGRPDDVVTNTPDATISTKFHEMFGDPVSSSKREAMREIFPMRGVRWTRTMARLDLSSGMHET